MTKGEDLHRLQELDSEGDAKRARLQEVEAALVDDSALQQARRNLTEAEKRARKWSAQQRDLELEIKSLSERISRSERRLYSGKVQNPKELSDLQAEAASLKRRRRRLEDELLEAMIEREEADSTRERAQEQLDQIETHWSAQQKELKAERTDLQARLAKIERKREALLPSVEATDLATYRSLRERKGGRIVVQVLGGACGGCGVTISPSVDWQLRQGEIVRCDTCGRIIVAV